MEPYYQNSACKIYHGDCLEVMQRIPDGSIDAIITDPPYGTTACKWDSVIPFGPMWTQLKRIIKPNGAIVLFGSEPFSSALRMSNIKMYKYDWVWDKKLAGNYGLAKFQPLKTHELISVFSAKTHCYHPIMTKGKMRKKGGYGLNNSIATGMKEIKPFYSDEYYPKSVYRLAHNRSGQRVHPTQKPVALMEYLIKTYTNEGETVLDFTMGSGTTGVACANLNRAFIGIDNEEEYCEISAKRLAQEVLPL